VLTPVGPSVGLLAELERRGLLDAPPRWLWLLAPVAPAAVTALGASHQPAAVTPLAQALSHGAREVRAAAEIRKSR
jgi:hypothetical protein